MDTAQKRGMLVPVSPSRTPRSTDKVVRSNENGNSSNKHDKEKGVNVQVILRCRPLSDEETRSSTQSVITCIEHRKEVAALQIVGNKQIDRTFTFDKVFGPTSKQKDVFDHAVSPIVNEVLEGYNCTIFAYGQTGTGKTYTMEGGGQKMKNGEFPGDAGVIPRSVRRIFDILEAQQAEYSMKVTFLELYNEEITDLLAPEDSKFSDDKAKKPIALMEDGKGGVFVRGLEEEIVYSAGEIYKILDEGSSKRRTAETLLNKQSSRSHSIFSITIHIKECTPEGEEMIKCGKLNLVDLAGSENISRSGARDGRAREAGEINKSLLTLGRVINALVEHSGHVPYRDSKLTRLLRDSLGGKTKTCIIATISPSVQCLEETLSTLDYAHRAKNIKNKPEINQKTMKSALIKDLYSEIDRLKQEVFAAREKNGIYIPRDRYLQDEAEKKLMSEKIERLEFDLESKDKQFVGLQELYSSQKFLSSELSDKLEETQRKLGSIENALLDLEQKYKQANATIKEKEYLILNLLKSEKALTEHAHELRSELASAAADVSGLFSKIDRKDKIEEGNKITVKKFCSLLANQLDFLHNTVSASVIQQENKLKEMEEDMRVFVSRKSEATEELQDRIAKIKEMYGSRITNLDNLAGELTDNSLSTFEKLDLQVSTHSSDLQKCFKDIVINAEELLIEFHSSLCKQEDKLAAFAQQQHEGQIRALEASRSIYSITSNFFQTLDTHTATLSKILEETQTEQGKQLSKFEKRFEECAANEEKQLLEKVGQMLASSNARKRKLVEEAVGSLRQYGADKSNNLQEEISNACRLTSSIKEHWTSHMNETENDYDKDTAATEKGTSILEEGLRDCKEKTRLASQQWSDAQNSLYRLGETNTTSVESIVRNGREASQLLRDKLSSSASVTIQDMDDENQNIIAAIKSSLKLDNDASTNIGSLVVPCFEDIKQLKSGHYRKVAEISENAHKSLETEYKVDEPSCSTPKKRQINLPSESSIEELRTPSFEELLKSFWESNSAATKQVNGGTKQFSASQEPQQSQGLRDSRAPLTAIN